MKQGIFWILNSGDRQVSLYMGVQAPYVYRYGKPACWFAS